MYGGFAIFRRLQMRRNTLQIKASAKSLEIINLKN